MKSGYVALVGRPNAGKSTLLNALVETKVAIVSDKPQTTRTRILGVKTTPKAQIVFVDTPGVHRPLHRLNVRMVDTALDALRSLDVVVVVVDASEATGKGTEFVLGLLEGVHAAGRPGAQQDRPGRQAGAPAADGVVPGALPVRRHRPDRGPDRRRRRRARSGHPQAPARTASRASPRTT